MGLAGTDAFGDGQAPDDDLQPMWFGFRALV
jgi:hypothetical protein